MPRKSMYPLPPALYPDPLVAATPGYETTYSREHCIPSTRDVQFYRSRTMHAETRTRALTDVPTEQQRVFEGTYPKHGTGAFTLPYYRKDSKGFRQPYTQPPHVDEAYLDKTENRDAAFSRSLTWSHPRGRPNYRTSYPSQNSRSAGPTTLGTYHVPVPSQLPPLDYGVTSGGYPAESSRAIEPFSRQPTGMPPDPVLEDPIHNAHRSARTVYKRAFGKSM